ncbi:MAG TPA: S6e family ribosomal protein [Candidatus Norongarragalinales archaeon]|nr:S6e family ribosomal protein [Candidatus Norongarragalinales archaeon]
MKLVINDVKAGKSYQKEVPREREMLLYGKKIGDQFDGGMAAELPGYKLEIRGGSDKDGFPMRPEVNGQRRAGLVLSNPPGIKLLRKGFKKKKTIVGNTVSPTINQLSLMVVEYGPKALEELGLKLTPKDQKPKEDKPAERKKKK